MGDGADRPRRGHADRHAAHAGPARAPRLTWAPAARGTYIRRAMSENAALRTRTLAQARRDDRRRRRAARRPAAALGRRARAWWPATRPRLLDALPVELTDETPAGNTVVLAADGSLITYFYENNRTPVTADQIADGHEAGAGRHRGLPLLRAQRPRRAGHAARAGHATWPPASVQEGGSTLTQQLVKQTLLQTAATAEERQAATEQSVGRKLREARLALALEETYSKDEILTRYLNIVYFGQGAYGIQAAAQRYFSVNADRPHPAPGRDARRAGAEPGQRRPDHQPRERARSAATRCSQRMSDLGHITDAGARRRSRAAAGRRRRRAPPRRTAASTPRRRLLLRLRCSST